MLNTYNVKGGSYSTHINAVSGTLVKNHPSSFFSSFHLNSKYSERILCDKPYIYDDERMRIPIIVLQIMVVGDMEVIAEIVKEDDYNVYCENKE